MTIIQALNALHGVIDGAISTYTDKVSAIRGLFSKLNGTSPTIAGETDYEPKAVSIYNQTNVGVGYTCLKVTALLDGTALGGASFDASVYSEDHVLYVPKASALGGMCYNATEPTFTLYAHINKADGSYPSTLLCQVMSGDDPSGTWDVVGSITLNAVQGQSGVYAANGVSISWNSGKSWADAMANPTIGFSTVIL